MAVVSAELRADDYRLTDDLAIHVASAGKEPEPRRLRALESLSHLKRFMRPSLVLVAITLALVSAAVVYWYATRPLFAPGFGQSGLVTNEYAVARPHDPRSRASSEWRVTSGSLFARNGWGWTGTPDGRAPGPTSRDGNDSAVFRAVTARSDFGNVAVSFDLRNAGLTTTSRTPGRSWDGINLILRWQSERHTYYVGLGRRDNTMLIKKKVPGGNVNGGSYYPLTRIIRLPVPYGRVEHFRATVTNDPDGAVTIKLYLDGRLLLHANDDGVGGPPLTQPGRVGLRGDNDQFLFRNFTVRGISSGDAGKGPTDQAPSDKSIRRRDR